MQACEPAERDWMVYRAVYVDGVRLREVADALEISRDEVEAAVERVDQWYKETSPEWASQQTGAVLMACRLHHDRLNYLYTEAMDAWRESKQPQTVTHQTPQGTRTTTVPSYGQPRYLTVAARIAAAQVSGALRTAKVLQKLNEPPARGCAREMAPPPEVAVESAEDLDVTVQQAEVCDAPSEAPAAPTATQCELPNPVRAVMRKPQTMRSA